MHGKYELLSPAGNFESLVAAIEGGCDAVYLGGKLFGARAFSQNFDDQELEKAVLYAHSYGVKIYVTANTLIYESEVSRFMEYIDFLYRIGVDAVIMQDIGMMDLVRQTYPDFNIHASTQMHIHNQKGVELVEKLGLTRTVIARETDYQTIAEIKKNTNIELEVFVHGALCVSYSGQCLMSNLIGHRSGNRGSCAGSCRQKYNLISNGKKVNTEEYLLSTKDLNSLENIGKLLDIGVDSFKIEGRMKSPSYVYTVTSLYKEAIESYIQTGKVYIDENKLEDLRKIFNREYTKGFLFQEDNNNFTNAYRPNHLGIPMGKVINSQNKRIKIELSSNLHLQDGIRILDREDIGFTVTKMWKNDKLVEEASAGDVIEIPCDQEVNSHSKIIKTTDYLVNRRLEERLKHSKRKVKIQGEVIAKVGEPFYLKISDGENTVEFKGNSVEKAKNAPFDQERLKQQLLKLGDTVFTFDDLKIKMDNNIFIPVSILNDYRRQAIQQLEEKRKKVVNYNKSNYQVAVSDHPHTEEYSLQISTKEQYELLKDYPFHTLYLEEDIYPQINDERKTLKLDRVLERHQNHNQSLLIGEMGSLNAYQNFITDWSFNVTNSYAIAFLHRMGANKVTLSYELTIHQIKEMIEAYKQRYQATPNLELIVYGKEEAMVCKFNLNKKYAVDNSYLEDRFHNLYPIKIKNDKMYIYNYEARNLEKYQEYFDLGINSLRFIVLDEKDTRQVEKVFRNLF